MHARKRKATSFSLQSPLRGALDMHPNVTIPRLSALRFGGLLVIELVTLRNAIETPGFPIKLQLHEQLSATIKKITSVGPGKDCARLCGQADEMLSELLNLLLDIRATETKEILFPIFMNRNRVLWGDDG